MPELGIFYNDTDVYNAIRYGKINDTLTISYDGVTNITMDEGRYQIVNASDKGAKFPAGRGFTNNNDEYVVLRTLKGIKKIDGGRSAKSIGKKRRNKKSSSKKSQKKRSRANRKGRKTRRH